MNSRLYEGWVRHRRYAPKAHRLNYPLFMLYLDLDEIDAVFAQSRFWSRETFNWASFRRADYFAPERGDLKAAVIDRICELSHLKPQHIHSVRMLTHLRYLGIAFNPVTFYYAFDEHNTLLAIMPEVTNTPWGERHQYVLTAQAGAGAHEPQRQHRHYREYHLDKAFHVSPFLPMEMKYRWVFGTPEQTLRVHLENYRQGERQFDATLVLEAKDISSAHLNRALIRFPWMTVKVVTGIYWHALRLWLKGIRFYPHPRKDKKETSA
ncbi:DUF1365 domain-containing protein [Saccharospirillum mangrovi]|uniref:DUF1365 domain-containing protein n=1 Tax=Saccharospirillum mangrovi TaxID=2161747 RepID=UPI000D34F51F|nr:DUF1365 domain-containing protein [Saccharospirillum mangrovi]